MPNSLRKIVLSNKEFKHMQQPLTQEQLMVGACTQCVNCSYVSPRVIFVRESCDTEIKVVGDALSLSLYFSLSLSLCVCVRALSVCACVCLSLCSSGSRSSSNSSSSRRLSYRIHITQKPMPNQTQLVLSNGRIWLALTREPKPRRRY